MITYQEHDRERAIRIGDVVQEWTSNDGERHDCRAYVQVRATVDGNPILIGTMVGVQPCDEGTYRAAQSGIRPHITTWWADASDWQDVPAARREEAEDAIGEARHRLWAEVERLRDLRTRSI